MIARQKDANKKIINKFVNEALDFESQQQWMRAAIRWGHCGKIADGESEQGFFYYSAFFCYKNANHLTKAQEMIDKSVEKYVYINDIASEEICRHWSNQYKTEIANEQRDSSSKNRRSRRSIGKNRCQFEDQRKIYTGGKK